MANKSVSDALAAATHKAKVSIVTMTLADIPKSTTVGDLLAGFQEAGYADDLRSMTLSEFSSAAAGAASSPAKSTASTKRRRSASAATPKKTRGRNRNTATKSGRASLDDDVMAYLSTTSEPTGADEVRKQTGGTAAQVRESLRRLTDRKMVKRSGKARATVYSPR